MLLRVAAAPSGGIDGGYRLIRVFPGDLSLCLCRDRGGGDVRALTGGQTSPASGGVVLAGRAAAALRLFAGNDFGGDVAREIGCMARRLFRIILAIVFENALERIGFAVRAKLHLRAVVKSG